MKRVVYVVGAAALAPLAGLATTAQAVAAPGTPASAHAKTKAVSLRHSAASPDFSNCTATLKASSGTGDSLVQAFKVWYTPGVDRSGSECIGTVSAYRYFKNNNTISLDFWVSRSTEPHSPLSIHLIRVTGKAGTGGWHGVRFGKEFPFDGAYDISVCWDSNYGEHGCMVF